MRIDISVGKAYRQSFAIRIFHRSKRQFAPLIPSNRLGRGRARTSMGCNPSLGCSFVPGYGAPIARRAQAAVRLDFFAGDGLVAASAPPWYQQATEIMPR